MPFEIHEIYAEEEEEKDFQFFRDQYLTNSNSPILSSNENSENEEEETEPHHVVVHINGDDDEENNYHQVADKKKMTSKYPPLFYRNKWTMENIFPVLSQYYCVEDGISAKDGSAKESPSFGGFPMTLFGRNDLSTIYHQCREELYHRAFSQYSRIFYATTSAFISCLVFLILAPPIFIQETAAITTTTQQEYHSYIISMTACLSLFFAIASYHTLMNRARFHTTTQRPTGRLHWPLFFLSRYPLLCNIHSIQDDIIDIIDKQIYSLSEQLCNVKNEMDRIERKLNKMTTTPSPTLSQTPSLPSLTQSFELTTPPSSWQSGELFAHFLNSQRKEKKRWIHLTQIKHTTQQEIYTWNKHIYQIIATLFLFELHHCRPSPSFFQSLPVYANNALLRIFPNHASSFPFMDDDK